MSLALCPLQLPRIAWPSSEKGDPTDNDTHLLGGQGGGRAPSPSPFCMRHTQGGSLP